MGVFEFFASISGVWWVLLILFLVMLGAYGLVFYWQRNTPILLKKIPQAFHHIQTGCRKIIAETRPYSPDDPLPYGPLVAGIHRDLDTIANQLVSLKSQFINIQDRVQALRLRPWQMLIGAPFYLFSWYAIRAEAQQVLIAHDELEKLVDLAWQEIEKLKKQAWLVALKARGTIIREKEIRQLLDNLSNQKLFGDTFEVAATQEEGVIEALERIPEYFLLADEEQIAQVSKKEVVCEVYACLNQAELVLDELGNILSLWTSGYQRLSGKAHQVQQQLDLVENLLANKPEEIDTTDQVARLRAVHTTVDVLVATLSRLEVESFPLVDQELDRAQTLISEVGRQVRKSFRQYPSLKTLIQDLLIVQKECSDLFSGLLKSPQYPVAWTHSNHEFLELNKATQALNLAQTSRTLEQIEQDMAKIEALSMRWATLKVVLNEIAALHEDLMQILTSLEIQEGLDWLQADKLLAEKITLYHPDNWSGAESVSSFANDILKIEAEHQAVLGRKANQSVPESELSVWIAQVKSLVEDHQILRLRSEKIRARFEWLLEEEEKTKETHQAIRSMVNQANWIVNSNLLLKQIAETDLKRIDQNLNRIGDELEISGQGMIEKKSRLVRACQEAIVVTAKGWLEHLNQEIDRRRALLEGKVDRLDQIAVLEDPVLEKSRRLLTREERRAEQRDPSTLLVLTIDQIVLELKGRSVVWQELVAAQEELEEIVETPLVDAFQHASQQRNFAITALDRAEQKIPRYRVWPPCSASIEREKNEIDQLEGKWKALKNQHIRAIWAVRQYGELAASYQVMAGKLENSYQLATQEQEKVLGLEKEIERLLRLWQQKGRGFARDPLVLEQIRDIRARANLAMDHLRQKWVASSTVDTGSVSYQEIVQGIMEIYSFLKTTRITVQQAGEETIELTLEESQPKPVERKLI